MDILTLTKLRTKIGMMTSIQLKKDLETHKLIIKELQRRLDKRFNPVKYRRDIKDDQIKAKVRNRLKYGNKK